MHVLGHIFIWLIAVGALAATVLSAKTYDVRNSWLKKVDQLEQDVEKNKPVIAEKRKRLASLQQEYAAKTLGWGKPMNDVAGQLNQNFEFETSDEMVVAWLGSIQQLEQSPPVVYLFQPQADGSSLYVGSFQYGGPSPGGQHVFVPAWTPRQDDFAVIQNPQGPFRMRPLVPAHFPSRYTDIRGEIAIAERLLADKQGDLADQKLREADAKAIREQRTNQLQGPDGLVLRLEKAEDARNLELEELDHWRREVDQARREIEQLMEESKQLEQQLNQTVAPESNPPQITAQVKP